MIKLMNEDCYTEDVVIHLGVFEYNEASSLSWSWLCARRHNLLAGNAIRGTGNFTFLGC